MQAALEIGSVFASYVVEARTPDVCGFAVYAARHRQFDQRVTLRIGQAHGETSLAGGAHLLDHHGVERVLDQGTLTGGTTFIVMERVEGEPVCAYCDARAIDIRGRVALLLQAAEALMYAHQHFQPHRNLTTELVLVDEAGHVKVCGFGLGQPGETDREATGHDLERLGAVTAVLLANAPADAGMSAWVKGLGAAQQRECARRRSSGVARLLRDLRGDLDAVVDHMRGRASEQYASVDLAAADLSRVLQGRSTRVYRRSRWERLQLWARFQPTTALAVAVLLLTAVGASAVFVRQTMELNRQRHESEARLAELVTLTGALETRLYAAAGSMPAPVPVRRALLRQMRETLDAATTDATVSPELSRNLARQYRSLAAHSVELGDASAAQVERTRAASTEHVKR